MIKAWLRFTLDGLPVAVPEKNGKDYFHHVLVSIKTLNQQFEKIEDEEK